jgi:dTDP-4-dehydrorhamnose 3,5-epimerase
MQLESTQLSDLFILKKPVRFDKRGHFCRLYGADEIFSAGRSTKAVHVNSSTSLQAGTLRGIHYQYPPYAEEKIVSCVCGSIWDVAVDLRPNSPSRFSWFGTVLSPQNGLSLIVPEGFGHAFLTLEPNTTVIYVVSSVYSLSHESGVRYDDTLVDIAWPILPVVLSEKDLLWAPLEGRIKELDQGFARLQ